MADIPNIPLKTFLKLFAPTYVLGTSYTVSLAFFEGLIYPEIKRSNLRRCLVLCDKLGFQRATVETGALRSVGREYMAICAPTRTSFHPKVWLMIGDGKAALLVGSGNLTQSGFMDNDELFDVVELEQGGPHQAVAKDIVDFLAGLRSLWSDVDARRLLALETLEHMQREIEKLLGSMPEDADPQFRFLSNFQAPLVEQFSQFFVDGILYVAAPYFGGGTAGLQLLQHKLAPRQIRVFPAVHGSRELDFPLADVDELEGVSVHSLKMGRKNAFAHLKVYGFEGDGGEWLFTTSANCTLAALEGDNVEAGLLRRVEPSLVQEYFAEHPRKKLPKDARKSDFADGDRWFPFWAVDRGADIELITGASADVPLTNVQMTIKVGDSSDLQTVPHLFESESIAHVNWSRFRQRGDRTKNTPLVSITAVDAVGRQVRGHALVDNPLLLSSDPTHRSAWRAAVSLLESEGIPESSDLASIFHLVQDVFDADDDRPDKRKDQAGLRKKAKSQTVIPDKVPIWPPMTDEELFEVGGGGGQLHNLQWFQRILAEFLNPRSSDDDPSAATTSDSMDDEVAAETKQIRIPDRVIKSAWKQAADSYEQLQERLAKIVVTRNTSKKIWAIATALFATTLLTRRLALKQADDTDYIPPLEELIRSFLTMLFVDRLQPADFRPPASCRYRHTTFPSIAEDLHETFGQDPSNDIAGIICLMFAHWHTTASRSGRGMPISAWLLFREVSSTVGSDEDLDRKTIQKIFEKFVADESDGVSWSDIEHALDDLSHKSWSDHEGFRQLCAIMRRADGQQAADYPRHLEDCWSQTARRIQRGHRWHFSVDVFDSTCACDGCTDQNTNDPTKRHDLRRLAPTICRSCGSVLVPERLWHAYEENHG